MIDWTHFEAYNPNKQYSFEKMCRRLFKDNFCTSNTVLHSNPNNPGVEVVPVKGKDGSYISFQSKYFSNKTDYNQIKESCEKIVKYYADNLEKVYLYCNKDIDTNSRGYKRCVEILKEASIDLIPITDQEIFEQVSTDEIVRDTYFNLYTLNHEWFKEQVKTNLSSLNNRFNKDFNVSTGTEKLINIFSENNDALKDIRNRINITIEKIDRYYGYEGINILVRLHEVLTNFSLKEVFTVKEYLALNHKFKEENKKELNQLIDDISTLEETSDEYNRERRKKIHSDIKTKELVLNIVDSAFMSEFEFSLIESKILMLKGEAGTGKTQIFANTSNNIIESHSNCILLLGNHFTMDAPVEKQILQNLEISDNNFNNFLNMLEGLGENTQQPIIVFIDGINETSHKKFWKQGIEKIYNKLKKYNYVKFAFSFRNCFENQLFSSKIKQLVDNRFIKSLLHQGLVNAEDDGIKLFLDFYNIPFSPSYYFNHQMKNPLFLTLFCQTYDGNEMDIRQLFDKLIDNADKESKELLNLFIPPNLLNEFLSEFISILFNTDEWYVDQRTLMSMDFWSINGLNEKKWIYVNSSINSNVLIDTPKGNETYYFISYHLLQDYLIAVHIFNKCNSVKEVKDSILQLFDIQEDTNYITASMVNPIIFIMDLCYEKYDEEIIFWLLEEVSKISIDDTKDIAEEYIMSYTWKSNQNIDKKNFIKVLKNYEVLSDTVFSVLIGNSTKEKNSLNADFLHEILFPQKIAHRDLIWTEYINYIDNDNRLMQLILSIESGELNTNTLSLEQNRLLLILFSWILSSSKRYIRDKCSKAMIEILKQNFQFCVYLLKKFENVNDPYIIQRLYGIVLGATLKRIDSYKDEYCELCRYIYSSIFNNGEVEPDILLRDYARQIIERWVFENPAQEKFDIKIISPPYNSSDIPKMEKNKKYDGSKNTGSAINSLHWSMNVDEHSYGDFGRYVFRSALEQYEDVDVYNCYLYAMDYIINTLGYSNESFQNVRLFMDLNRHETKKLERIGKKYQWIAFYKILAKISDNHEISNLYEDEKKEYEGPWNPYVRDFDPTLNINFLIDDNAPTISTNFTIDFVNDFNSTDESVLEWSKTKSEVFDLDKNDLILTDSNQTEWIVLYQAQNFSKKEKPISSASNKRQIIWRQARAYFTKNEDYNNIKREIKKKNFDGRWFPEGFNSMYTNFNREFYWSPSTNYFIENEWASYEIKSEEYEEIRQEPEELLLQLLKVVESDDLIGSYSEPYKKYNKKKVGEVLPSYNTYLWEEEYDASQEDATSFEIPCSEVIKHFDLTQKKYDGYFYDGNTLVTYDTRLRGDDHGLIIRKDYLLKFLEEKNYKVFWTVMGEKQFIHSMRKQTRSEWSGFISMAEDETLAGSVEFKTIN